MMKTTDYCSYELSKALKAAGFDEPCDAFYLPPMKNRPEPFFSGRVKRSIKSESNAFHFSAPTLWQAQKWLREKWDLHIDVYPDAGYMFDADDQICEEWNYWTFDIMHVMSTRKIVVDEEQYGSYEEALTEGINSALELIKKGE